MRLFWGLLLAAFAAQAQQPPVVLVDGYHLTCSTDNLNSTHSFGMLEQLLSPRSRVVFFPTCNLKGRPIEEIASALAGVIQNLNAPQVDVVSVSMGGLVLRSYLAGKQTAPGVFQPPLDHKVRKWVSIATPNFGILYGDLITLVISDAQINEMLPSSRFLFDLATWNQNRPDIRGVDALAIIGNAGIAIPFSNQSDALVATTSGSLGFIEPDERTRIVPYCHSADAILAALPICNEPSISKILSDTHPTYRIIQSFLADTGEWKTIGTTPSQDPVLSKLGGTDVQTRDQNDVPVGSIQNRNFITAPKAGTYTPEIVKPGPRIALAAPAAGLPDTLSLAPRMLVAIYGTGMDGAMVTVNGQAADQLYTSANQINVVMPIAATGLVSVTVSSVAGKSSIRALVEPAAPAVFSLDGSGGGPAAAIRVGDFEELFLTGLGLGTPQVAARINGVQAQVTYSGPAPGFPAVDQINFQLPAGLPTGMPLPLEIIVNGHRSNITTLTL